MASSLVRKLRIQPGHRLLILNAPSGYIGSLADLPEGIEVSEKPQSRFGFVQVFVKDSAELADLGPAAFEAVKYDGLL